MPPQVVIKVEPPSRTQEPVSKEVAIQVEILPEEDLLGRTLTPTGVPVLPPALLQVPKQDVRRISNESFITVSSGKDEDGRVVTWV